MTTCGGRNVGIVHRSILAGIRLPYRRVSFGNGKAVDFGRLSVFDGVGVKIQVVAVNRNGGEDRCVRIDNFRRTRERGIGKRGVFGLVIFHAGAAVNRIHRAVGVDHRAVRRTIVLNCALGHRAHGVCVHRRCAQINVVVPLQDNVNIQLRHQHGKLFAKRGHIVIGIVRAVRVNRFVQRNNFPRFVACGGIRLQPSELVGA